MTLEHVKIGTVVACHGLCGNVKLKTTSKDPVWLGQLSEVSLTDEASGETKILPVERSWVQSKTVMMRFKGYDSRTSVEPLIGQVVFADLSPFHSTDSTTEFWADDIIGLSVIDSKTGKHYGQVVDLLSSAGSDFLEIERPDCSSKVVVPFINQFFLSVNLEKKQVLVDLLQSFFEDHDVTTAQ